MAMPIFLGVGLVSAVALLAFLVWMGGTASGERVQISFYCSCSKEAKVIMSERIETLGLGEPELNENEDGLVLLVTLPDIDGAVESIPKLLSQSGELLVKTTDGTVLADRKMLKLVSLSINESGMPYLDATFEDKAVEKMAEYVASNSEGYIDFWVDQQLIAHRPNTVKIEASEPIRIIPEQGDTRKRMQLAADAGVVLSSLPYPCELRPSPAIQLY
ncbi:MAG: hypothetical protein CMK59_14920 [Proteobacteria bacterium]|nr:hypothetical protein [Pseudomonadota bacterium]